MPGFDRTGPMGAGPMTSGARGLCNPATAGTIPAYAGMYGYGRDLGLRRGFIPLTATNEPSPYPSFTGSTSFISSNR